MSAASVRWPEVVWRAAVLRGLDDRAKSDLEASGHLREVSKGERIFASGDSADALFVALSGKFALVAIRRGDREATPLRTLEPGDSFGEEATLRAGGARTADATCVEAGEVAVLPAHVLRRVAERGGSSAAFGRIERTLRRAATLDAFRAAGFADPMDFERLLDASEHVYLERGEALYRAGDPAHHAYLIGDGMVQLQSEDDERLHVRAYLTRGDLVGSDEVRSGALREFGAAASGAAWLVAIPKREFAAAARRAPALIDRLQRTLEDKHARALALVGAVNTTQHALKDLYRLSIARSLLVIDQDSCARCGHCAWSCASVHDDGVSRLLRRGDKVVTPAAESGGQNTLLLPNSCQHCKNPACMVDCPTGAIGREPRGEVFIREDLCIGCGNCAKGCPWDNIQMAPRERAGIFASILSVARSQSRAAAAPSEWLPPAAARSQSRAAAAPSEWLPPAAARSQSRAAAAPSEWLPPAAARSQSRAAAAPSEWLPPAAARSQSRAAAAPSEWLPPAAARSQSRAAAAPSEWLPPAAARSQSRAAAAPSEWLPPAAARSQSRAAAAPSEWLPPAAVRSADVAVKCDLCTTLSGGPACVAACPTQAIARVQPDDLIPTMNIETSIARTAAAGGPSGPVRGFAKALFSRTPAWPWLASASLVALALVLLRARAPESWQSGAFAGVLLVALVAYFVPKRVRRVGSGAGNRKREHVRLRPWFVAHLAGGIGSLGAVALHAGPTIPSNLAGALVLAFWGTAFVGAWGAVAYRMVPKRLSRLERGGALPEDLSGALTAIEERTFAALSGRSELVKALFARVLRPYALAWFGPFALVAGGRTLREEEARLAARIRKTLAGQGESKLDGLDAIVRLAVDRRAVRAQRVLQASLRVWHPLHVVGTALVVVLLALHAVAELWYR